MLDNSVCKLIEGMNKFCAKSMLCRRLLSNELVFRKSCLGGHTCDSYCFWFPSIRGMGLLDSIDGRMTEASQIRLAYI